jgi:chromosome segregation ATPase
MGKMTSRLILVVSALLPTGSAAAQSVAAGEPRQRDAAAAEVALLRQTVQRLAAVVVESQVLASRLAAQQQRVVREQDAIARAEEALDAAGRRQDRTRAMLERADRSLGNVVEEPRSELRREVESLRAELDDQEQELTRLRTRLSQAEQGLRSEQRSYAELDAAFTRLLREVERLKR